MESKWKVGRNFMESKWKVNKRGFLDDKLLKENFDDLNFENACDIANNAKGILRLYVYNITEKSYRYE